MSKPNDNRTRTSIPILGLDTATPDLPAKDGTQETLHNLRHAGGAWRSIKPLVIKQQLRPAPGFEDQFSKLTICYRHPASDEGVYIASIPNDDGTINLQQVVIKGETLAPVADDINPVYIYARVIEISGGMKRSIISIVSLRPVASDISVKINYTRGGSDEILSATLIILKGATESTHIEQAIPTNNADAKLSPESDASGKYVLFQNKEAAEKFASGFAHNLPSDIHFSHFGNILLLTNHANRFVVHYYLDNNNYEKFDIPSPPVVKQSAVYNDIGQIDLGIRDDATYIMKNGGEAVHPVEATMLSSFFNIDNGLFYYRQTASFRNFSFFWGEICFFAAFQMTDGSLISPSALNIASSEAKSCDPLGRTFIRRDSNGEDHLHEMAIPRFETFLSSTSDTYVCAISRHDYNWPEVDGKLNVFNIMICPYITIRIPDKININLIKHVILYSTRINPIWDAEKLKTTKREGGVFQNFTYYRADNKLPEQPFYFMQSIPIEEFVDGEKSMHIDATRLKNIEQNDTYMPVDVHSTFYNTQLEYNSRMHIWGNLGQKLFPGYGNDFFTTKGDAGSYDIATSIKIDNKEHYVIAPTLRPFNDGYPTTEENLIYNRIISYPDSRAKYMHDMDPGLNRSINKIKLKPALENNYAYAICTDNYEECRHENIEQTYKADYVKYSVKFSSQITLDSTSITPNCYVYYPNKLRVSALNNPFSFPLDTSYAIGTDNNRILAVNSAAIEMSDAKFGEFPLYVFTDEGVFALQSGSGEVLYSAVVPLNYDRIVNPDTLAVNYNILYITSRGLHALFSNQSTLLSGPINTNDDLPRLDFLTTARLCYQHKFGEVILYNPAIGADNRAAYPYAYVFSLNSKTWSTRDFSGYKLNVDEIVLRDSATEIRMFDLNDEQTTPAQPVEIRLISRPLKLGSTEFKRLETLIPRWSSDCPQPVHVALEGSVDLKQWMPLRTFDCSAADRSFTLRRTPFSFRFLRIRLDTSVLGDFELSGFDAEYYLRFLHRMR